MKKYPSGSRCSTVRLVASIAMLFVTSQVGAATLAQRVAAVEHVVGNAAECTSINNYYWEIGNANGVLASGRQGLLAPTENTKMAVASAGKWLYGAYVVQKENGQLSPPGLYSLTMRGEYTNWSVCLLASTVGKCYQSGNNDTKVDNPDHKFNYQGSQFQAHAVNQMGLAAASRSGLQNEMQTYLGTDIDFTFNIPAPAAGMRTSAEGYGLFLRKLLSGSLLLGTQLGAHSTDAGPANLQSGGASPPLDYLGKDWDYATGYWIENDPNGGDGAFSSPGAFGFYPWIDASETWYGILARRSSLLSVPFKTSTLCGQKIRDAWLNPLP